MIPAIFPARRLLAVLVALSVPLGTGTGSALADSAAPASAPPSVDGPSAGTPQATTTVDAMVALSNETTVTRWAHTARTSTVLARPVAGAARVARLHRYTEDGFPEIYLLLAVQTDASGHQWVKVRLPMRPNGSVGWVPRDALGAYHVTHEQLVVSRRSRRISLYDSGHLRWSAPAGVGKPATPTPGGYFWIREVFKITDPHSGYYPYAFGTADYSTLTDWPGGGVVGIHGPYGQPQLIPGDPSHGCVRLRVSDDAWLGQHLQVGTPLLIT